MISKKLNKTIVIPALMGAGILFGFMEAGAVPAMRGLRSVTQPDGSQLEIQKTGDEYFHLTLTADNCLLTENNGVYEYARVVGGRIESTGIAARSLRDRTMDDEKLVYRIHDGGESLRSVMMDERSLKRSPLRGPGRFASSFPAKGDANVLVVLVQYEDVKFNLENPYDYYNGMLNEEGFSQYGGTGCAKEYFKLNSTDQFRPHFNVYGPLTLPNPRAFYGENDERGSDKNAHLMVSHAIDMLDDEIDFHDYDVNGDGEVDNVFIIYAGQGEATYGSEDTVWPHSGDLLKMFEFKIADGLYVNHYACCNEWLQNRPDGVGTFIHEFSHVIGLPDLYCTSGVRIGETPSNWSVLDYGPYNNSGCTPPNYSAYERYAMGWVEPTVLEGQMNLKLDEMGLYNQAAIIPVEGTENEFFLIENRQNTGWDTYLPGHGMLIWHVDYDPRVFQANEVNNNATHQRVDIIEANGEANGLRYDIMSRYAFPGPTGNSSIGFDTTPALKTWSGSDTGITLTDIEETPEGRITCRVNGGFYLLETPQWKEVSDNADECFRLNWDEVSGAESYDLEVTASFGEDAGTLVNNMGSGSRLSMPEGWSSGSTKVYSTSGNYGQGSPSYKMETNEDWILSPELPSDAMSVKLWMKGTQLSGSTLDVMGEIDGEWVLLKTLEPKNNVSSTAEVEVERAGVRRIKFVYHMVKGRVAIDDIEISYGRPSYILENYSPKRIEGELSAVVETIGSDARTYICRLRARQGDETSRWSEPLTVNVEKSGVETIASSDLRLTLSGRTVSVSDGSAITLYDISGRKVASGRGEVTAPARGLYIVVSGDARRKITVR